MDARVDRWHHRPVGPALLVTAIGAIMLLSTRKTKRSPGGTGDAGGGSTGGGAGGADGQQGAGGGLTPEQAAIQQLCRTPGRLSAPTQRILIEQVIEPLWDEYAATLGPQPAPDELDRVLTSIAAKVIGRCGPRGAKPGAQLVAMELARAVWWRRSGASGL